ncbi:hypothetical protein [Microbispora bryophytorum]|uniref:Uncharacterized protein n=1 Tax=Microbispora bryophytorum subsp. camponoti TaxID=1677852 RepID=A0ABR8KYG8_9ACTN|nr:hypothetical protein [Microbispora camponoti]MBD3142270.1 hypothetical protein [Microbispora camponoti]
MVTMLDQNVDAGETVTYTAAAFDVTRTERGVPWAAPGEGRRCDHSGLA